MTEATNLWRVAVLGSGAGSTTKAIIQRSREPGATFEVKLVISSSENAGILEIAAEMGVDHHFIGYQTGSTTFGDDLSRLLTANKIDLLVLAGFMRLLPNEIIGLMEGRVINTHPALLPKHGGQGMYGKKVHQAVLSSGDLVSGATVHWVTEKYDEGGVIDQVEVPVLSDDSVETLESRVKRAEKGLLVDVIDRLSQN